MHDVSQEVFKMLKNDVIKRLDELQGCEKLEFVLGQHKKIVYTKNIVNNINEEVVIANCVYETNSAIIPYCSIDRILPYPSP